MKPPSPRRLLRYGNESSETREPKPISEHDHRRGPDHALVTLMEYGDFTCSHCAAAYPVVRELLLHYRTSVRFVFRHNPRAEPGEGGLAAARAAEAAALQGRFWDMHDLLFERHADPINEQRLTGYAELLGLDLPRFSSDFSAPAVLRRVREDQVDGLRSGVIGTPTFFLNGRHFRDKPDLDTLSRAIASALLLSRGTSASVR